MRCPTCGHPNNDLATRCSACGSILPEPVAQDDYTDVLEPTHELSQELDTEAIVPVPLHAPGEDTQESTAKQPQAIVQSPQSSAEQLQLHEHARAADDHAPSKHNRVLRFLHAHERALGVTLALVVVGVTAGVWFVLSAANTPTYAQIEEDLSKLIPTYIYSGGTYGPDLEIPLSGLTVTKREATQTPEGMEVANGVGPTAFGVEAEATYDDGTMHVVRDVSITYVRQEDGWAAAGELAEQGVSLTARAGVSEDKVKQNVSDILGKATNTNGAALNDIYEGGSFSIQANDFEGAPKGDTATDDLVIHCEKSNDFSAYGGNVTAHFAFESGEWRLRSAEAEEGISTRSFKPLVGTWRGVFTDQLSDDGRCYGAQETPFEVTIDQVGDSSLGSGTVTGSISVLAHYHARLKKDADNTPGDSHLEDISFSGTISTEHDETTSSSLNIVCSTTGNPQGEVNFVLSFGTDDDPSAAVARITTSYSYEERLLGLIPQRMQATYTDIYLLSRA